MSLIFHDFIKAPIDRLYFQNPRRPLMGMRNSIIDILTWFSKYSVRDYPGLWLVKFHLRKIQIEFENVSKTLQKRYFHDVDPWFENNEGYYFYKAEKFPLLKSLIDEIPCIYKETALFAVVNGPMKIAPHRAETNLLLRYHLTIEGGSDCTLYTEKGLHVHREGEDILFDHARYHELSKTGEGRRVVLILDVKRF